MKSTRPQTSPRRKLSEHLPAVTNGRWENAQWKRVCYLLQRFAVQIQRATLENTAGALTIKCVVRFITDVKDPITLFEEEYTIMS